MPRTGGVPLGESTGVGGNMKQRADFSRPPLLHDGRPSDTRRENKHTYTSIDETPLMCALKYRDERVARQRAWDIPCHEMILQPLNIIALRLLRRRYGIVDVLSRFTRRSLELWCSWLPMMPPWSPAACITWMAGFQSRRRGASSELTK